ncbi:MAG TPA: hypothetical protein VD947_01800 [Patescibacteria group bacterium]|nr:hypothetical protein [Patescibacteria group bacterium]
MIEKQKPPNFPPVEPDLVEIRDASGGIEIVDPHLPDDFRVSDITESEPSTRSLDISVDGNGLFHVDAQGNIIAKDAQGIDKVYNSQTKTWQDVE